jgi:hypothetical protein
MPSGTNQAVFIVHDLNSFSGVRVNGLTISEKRLSSGDVLELGDRTFAVNIEGENLSLATEEKVEEPVALLKSSLNFRDNVPSVVLPSLVLCLIAVVAFLAWPITSEEYTAWNSGPVSNPHSFFSHDCTVCHSMNFTSVQDAQCTQCHALTEHFTPQDSSLDTHHLLADSHACIDCHQEHNGNHNFTITDSKLCADCHANNSGVLADSSLLEVASIEKHPQFQLSLPVASESLTGDRNGVLQRVSMDRKEALHDPGSIKLNHAVHLAEGILGPEGPVNLSCADCHTLASDRRSMLPISFEQHCVSCHTLGFEEELQGEVLPHAVPDEVFAAILGAYTRLTLKRELNPQELQDFFRVLPGRVTSTGQQGANRTSQASQVLQQARTTEAQVFERTACQLCHSVTEKSTPQTTSELLHSRYEVADANVIDIWMKKAAFSHGAHGAVDCSHCHSGVYESEQSADILLPGVTNCQQCHASVSSFHTVQSDCVMCHNFHDPLPLTAEMAKAVQPILFGTMNK